MTCERCHKETDSSTMSWFNTQTICMDCSDAEKENPNYKLAKDIELEQVQAGNLNYKGLFGIPDEATLDNPYPISTALYEKLYP